MRRSMRLVPTTSRRIRTSTTGWAKGIALKSLTIEGPLFDVWPPESTRQLLTGVEFEDTGEIRLTKEPYEHVVDIVARFAPLAFRRPLVEDELEAYASSLSDLGPAIARGSDVAPV